MDEVEQIKEWLRSKGTTLWGRSWDMTQDQAVVEAAEWFRDQTDQFFDWKYEQEAPDDETFIGSCVGGESE